MQRRRSNSPGTRQRGVSLIEMMLAMLLGLLVVAAAGGMFLANKRVYGSTETLNRIQENGRVAFELMSRDIREAGATPCGRSAKFVNMLKNADNGWWSGFQQGLAGYDGSQTAPGTTTGTAATNRVAGTDAIDLHGANAGDDYVIVDHTTPSAEIQVNKTDGLSDGEIIVACNTSYALIFQITGVQTSAKKIQHQGGNGTPGNCGQEFQHKQPTSCSGASNPYGYCFTGKTSNQCDKFSDSPAVLAKIQSVRWYIGNNGRGSRSLYRARLSNTTNGATPNIVQPEEIAEGVRNLQIEYRVAGSTNYQPATAIADWSTVNAVRLTLEVEGVKGALSGQYIKGTDGEALSQSFTHVVAIRNREGVL